MQPLQKENYHLPRQQSVHEKPTPKMFIFFSRHTNILFLYINNSTSYPMPKYTISIFMCLYILIFTIYYTIHAYTDVNINNKIIKAYCQ